MLWKILNKIINFTGYRFFSWFMMVIILCITLLSFAWGITLIGHILDGFEYWSGIIPWLIKPIKGLIPSIIELHLLVIGLCGLYVVFPLLSELGIRDENNEIQKLKRKSALFNLIVYLVLFGAYLKYYPIFIFWIKGFFK